MTNSSSNKIIRGAEVKGVVFFDSKGESPAEKQLSALKQKAPSKGKTKDFEESLKEAEKFGYRQGLEEGHRRGYEAGRMEGLELGYKLGIENTHQEIKDHLELLKSISETFLDKQREMFEEAKPQLIKFCLAVCESILRKTLSNPLTLATHIERLLNEAKEILKEANANIYLSPDDFNLLQSTIKLIKSDRIELKQMNFIPDHTFDNGNFRIESSLGLLNFDIKRLLSEIENITLEVNPTALPKEIHKR